MEPLQIKDKKFAVSIPEAEILKQVKRVAGEINRDLAGSEPVFLAILNGSFIFAADLMREIELSAQISFVKLASYVGTSSTGSVCEMIGLNVDISGRDVVVVEDIVDSGLTMKYVTEMLAKYNPRSISICTLLGMGWIMTVTGGTPVTFTPSWNRPAVSIVGKRGERLFQPIQNNNDEEYYYFRCSGIR